MKKLRSGLILCLMTILAAVSCSTAPVKWYKSGTSQVTFTRDKADCEEAVLSTGTTEKTKQIYSVEGCLEAKGYTAIPLSSQ
jgi:hypothetical protein